MESGSKIRQFVTNKTIKVVLFLLISALAATALILMLILANTGINPECLIIKQYEDSYDFRNNYVYDACDGMCQMLSGSVQMPLDANYYYYISDGKKSYTNVKNTNKAFFSQYDNAFYAFENGKWSFGKSTHPVNTFSLDNDVTLYIAFSDEFMDSMQKTWQDNKNVLAPYALGILFCLLFLIIFLIWLVYATGKIPQDKDLHLAKQDKIYSDILLFALMGSVVLAFAIIFVPNFNFYPGLSGNINNYESYALIAFGVCEFIVLCLCLAIFLSIVRKIKAGILIKHSLIYTVCYKIYDYFKSLFDGRKFDKYPLTKSLFYRQTLFISTSFILVLFTFALMMTPIFWFPALLEIVIVYWYIKGSRKTYEEINKGFNESLQEQMKAERMKIALVTNVSHDLKTPLTSIISYIELISKEENLSEPVRDYIKILSEKSDRLKNIVSDLFDLAKSTSGDIEVNLEKIDLKKLLEQTLADMDDKIIKSGLKFKLKLPDGPVNILADGKKLYRVFLNIIDNALKYSLDNTRVFINLEENDQQAIVTVINTSSYEMDFSVEEVLQRFTRGDKSRTTEGSGLGLSISESFARLCGAKLELNIEGDQFKVEVIFSRA